MGVAAVGELEEQGKIEREAVDSRWATRSDEVLTGME
jgi:hypothetical protein